MRKAKVFMHNHWAGVLMEGDNPRHYVFQYLPDYTGAPVSLTMPLSARTYSFENFPPFFEGLLPEGIMLEGLLRKLKIDRDDYFSQLLATGTDLVGAVSVQADQNE